MKQTSQSSISLLITLVLASASSVQATLADYQSAVTNQTSIISYYTFDRTNASDVFKLHNGTAQGGVTYGQGIGDAGRAVQLSGSGRINLGTVSDFNFSDGTGSVEAWVRAGWPGTFSAYNPCIFADRNGGPVTWSVHMNGDKSGVGVWNGSTYLPLAIPAPGTNWHHLAVTFDNSSGLALATIYWDGVAVGDRNQDLGIGSNPTQLGSSAAGVTDEGWIGSLDEVAFYADALTPEEVQAHYQALFAGTPPVITRQPRGGIFLPGVTLQLSVVASGPNLSYQWFKGTNKLQGETSSVLVLPSLSANLAGSYHVVVSNPAANVPSSDAVVNLSVAVPAPLAAYQSAVTNESSLISYFSFDQLTANDLTGAHDGTLQGTAYFAEGVTGGPDQGLLLDGAGYVSLGPVSDFDFVDSTGSVEAWVRADWTSEAYDPCIFSDRDGNPVTWSIHLNRDKQGLGMWNGYNYAAFAIPDAGTNWHHLAAIFDSGNFTAYWDGAALGTVAEPLGDTPQTVQIGSSGASTAREGWVGRIDEVAFYADPLSDSSVKAHYRAVIGTARPSITKQPVGGAFYPGRAFQLSVSAIGADMSYQWFKNSEQMTGETNWFLSFTALAAADSGTYYVSVTNPGGTTNSATAVLLVGSNLAQYQSAVLGEPSLISYYMFDAGDAADDKGTNQGSLIGNTTFTPGVGQGADQALLLDGGSDIDLGQVPAFEFTNGTGSVEAWLRPDWTSDPGYDPCLFADRSGGPTDWSLHMVRTRGAIGNWNGSHFQSLPLGDTSGWHHFAVTFDAGQVVMYWDGAPLGNFAQPINLSVGLTAQIGSSSPVSTAEGWIGAMDEVAFYSSALSADAVRSHFLAMVGAPAAPSLNVARSSGQLTLSWSVAASGYILESSDTLPGTSWGAVPGVAGNSVTVDLTNGVQFFRLRKP